MAVLSDFLGDWAQRVAKPSSNERTSWRSTVIASLPSPDFSISYRPQLEHIEAQSFNSEPVMTFADRPNFLRNILLVDAATCVVSGLLMTIAAKPVANLTGLPAELLGSAGLSLFPIAAFIAFVATRQPAWPTGVWLVILGNIGWVVGCLGLLLGASPTILGMAFVSAQAIAVAVLAELEFTGLRRSAVRP
jgi:hypothetical protein